MGDRHHRPTATTQPFRFHYEERAVIFALYARSAVFDPSSIERQISSGRRHAAAYGASTIEYIDNGVSGAIASWRPRLQQLIGDAELGVFRNLFVEDYTRLGRSLSSVITIVQRLENENVTIHTLTSVALGLGDDFHLGFFGRQNLRPRRDTGDR